MKLETFGLSALLIWTGVGASAQMQCAGLTPEALGASGVVFTKVTAVAKDDAAPTAQCRICAVTAFKTIHGGSATDAYPKTFDLAPRAIEINAPTAAYPDSAVRTVRSSSIIRFRA